jgi:hypothetical protein
LRSAAEAIADALIFRDLCAAENVVPCRGILLRD